MTLILCAMARAPFSAGVPPAFHSDHGVGAKSETMMPKTANRHTATSPAFLYPDYSKYNATKSYEELR